MAKALKLYWADDIINFPAPTWIIPDLVQDTSTVLLFGPSGIGKSFLALEMACAVGSGGTDIFGVCDQGPIVYVVGEGVAGIGSRLKAWQERHGPLIAQNMLFVGEAVQLHDPESIREFMVQVGKALDGRKPKLVIFDTLARCASGLDENASRDMGLLITGMDKVKDEWGCAVLAVHHSTKAKADVERGSGATYAAMDTVLGLTQVGSSEKILLLEPKKQKNGEEVEPRKLKLEKFGDSCVLATDYADISSLRENKIFPNKQPVKIAKAILWEAYLRPGLRDPYLAAPHSGDYPLWRLTVLPGGLWQVERRTVDDPAYHTWLEAGLKWRGDTMDEALPPGLSQFDYHWLMPEEVDDWAEDMPDNIRMARAEAWDHYPDKMKDASICYMLWGVKNGVLGLRDAAKKLGTAPSNLSRWKKHYDKTGMLPPIK